MILCRLRSLTSYESTDIVYIIFILVFVFTQYIKYLKIITINIRIMNIFVHYNLSIEKSVDRKVHIGGIYHIYMLYLYSDLKVVVRKH